MTVSALAKATEITLRAREDNLTWDNADAIYRAIQEEILEIQQAETPAHRADELGDLLWAVVGLACYYQIDSEAMLHRSADKFLLRWQAMQAMAKKQNRSLKDLDADQLDQYWKQAKNLIAAQSSS